MEEDDVEMAHYDVACHTDGCENSGVTLRILAAASDPYVVCGPCGVRITEVVEVP